jgi:hypothetical protein
MLLVISRQLSGEAQFHGKLGVQNQYSVVNFVLKQTFMCCISLIGSFKKFRCIISIAMFPVLQWAFRDDITKSEIVPELAYGIEGELSKSTKALK